MSAPKDPKKYALWKIRISEALKGKYVGEKSSMFGRRGQASPRWKGGPITVNCAICGKPIKRSRSELKKARQSYCSRECLSKWKRKNYKGQGNSRWACRLSDLVREAISGKMKGNSNAKGAKHPDNAERNRRMARRGKDNPNYGKHTLLGIPKSLEHRKKIGQAKTGSHLSEKTKQKIGHASRLKFRDPEFLRKYQSSLRNSPNRLEQKFDALLQKVLPGKYKFTGNFEVVIGGKSPDFFNVRDETKVIEIWGDYWHRGDDPQDRINYFKRFGYSTLIIWEHELNDENLLVQKLKKFNCV